MKTSIVSYFVYSLLVTFHRSFSLRTLHVARKTNLIALNSYEHSTAETIAEGTAIARFPVLTELLDELEALNNIRFVVVGTGAILESVGKFSNLRYSEGKQGLLGQSTYN